MDNASSMVINSNEGRKFAYSYERWSSQLQSLGSSEARQGDSADILCQKFGLTLVDAIKDRGVSAKDGDNLVKEFARMAQVVKKGEYVVIENANRLTRAGKRIGINAVWELVKNDITLIVGRPSKRPIIITKENYEDMEVWSVLSTEFDAAKSSNDYATANKIAAWAKKKQAMARGEKVRLYNPPYWLKNTPKDTYPVDYIIDHEKVKVLKRIFDLYSQGHGIVKITKMVNQEGHPNIFHNGKANCKYGKKYSTSSVGQLLRDQRVIGLCNIVTPPVKIFPVVIEEDLFWKCQSMMDKRTDTFPSSKAVIVNLFSGLCKCSVCNENLTMVSYPDELKDGVVVRRAYLRCYNSVNGVCKVKKRLRLYRVEEAFKQILGRIDILHAHVMKEEEVEPSRIPELETQLNGVLRARKRLYDLFKMETPPSDLSVQLQRTQQEEDAIVRDIDKEKARLLGTQPIKDALETYHTRLIKHFDDPNYRIQIREVLRSIVDKIIVDGESRSFKVYFRNVENPIEVVLGYHDFTIKGIPFNYPEGRIDSM